MCRAVLQLGSSLDLPVIVEGVTSPAVLTLLRDMGHRYLQGYVFSRPLEAGQLADGGWEVAGATDGVELPAQVSATAGISPAQSPGMPS
jgi:predicted signal transduction protein with EAL and GGDEF domain